MSCCPPPADPTFRSYMPSQASTYAARRPGYAGPLLDHVLALHHAAGGQFGTMLDVGTGTGQVVRDLAPRFAAAFAVDPSVEMIAKAAEATEGTDGNGRGNVVFLVCAAEDIDQLDEVEHGSVDLITAGMAAHWFDMPRFWAAAARVLKPGGSVALWTKSSFYCHPTLTPNAAQVQAILSEFEDVVLGPYALPGNKISQSNYQTLALPWDSHNNDDDGLPGTTASPASEQSLFDKSTLRRHEWDVGGRLTDGHDFFGGDGTDTTLAALRAGMATASMVTRWRAAHPALVGTDRDCVRVLVGQLREALGAGDGEDEDEDEHVRFRTGTGTGVLFVNRAK